jgi:hypothetical protein
MKDLFLHNNLKSNGLGKASPFTDKIAAVFCVEIRLLKAQWRLRLFCPFFKSGDNICWRQGAIALPLDNGPRL